MTRVIKNRFHIILTAVLSIMIMLTALPIQKAGQVRVEAASFQVNANNLYFDITDLPNKSMWNNNVYVYFTNWGNFHKMSKCNGVDIYYLDLTGWNMNGYGDYIFTKGNDWNDINAYDNTRTVTGPMSLGGISSKGVYCSWNGNYGNINGKKVYSINASNTAVEHLSPVPAGGTRRIYFDATFSKLSYKTDNTNSQGDPNAVHSTLNYGNSTNIPYDNDSVYYYITGNGNQRWSGPMTRLSGTDLWYVDIFPNKQKNIRFTSWQNPSNETAAENGDGTAMYAIPSGDRDTFFADTGDSVVYNGNGGNRGGYWGNHNDLRDAESAKNTTVVSMPSSSMTESDDVLYLNSTFFDYYTDYELNGFNRVNYPVNTVSQTDANNFASHRNWVPFRQLSQAMSGYYTTNNVPSSNTIYTGHYQPSVTGWGYPFSDIAGSLSLRGWSDYPGRFQVNNNSVRSLDSTGTNFYRYATQGILSNTLYNGQPVLYGTTTVLPHFNSDFLNGNNSKNAKLGEVYENVAFPFTKVDRDGNGIYYWSFDSAATTLRLNKNTNNETKTEYPYYLKKVGGATVVDRWGKTTEASRAGGTTNGVNNTKYDRNITESRNDSGSVWSKNLVSAGIAHYKDQDGHTNDYASNKYGFFPLNDTSINESNKAGAAKYNYGFGTKLEFNFTLSNNGNISIVNGANEAITAATTFNFSGDDDVWVFIDDKLVLDIGGDHGRTSGCINFSRNNYYDYSYSYRRDDINEQMYQSHDDVNIVTNRVNAASVLVSEVKKSTNHNTVYSNVGTGVTGNATQESLWTKLGISTDAQKDKFYKSSHKLTFFYMERGMWESNMRLQFNFPDNDTLEIGKTIDTSNVMSDLKPFFNNASFVFSVSNLVTHYGAKAETAASGYNISQQDIADYGSASGTQLKPVKGAKYTKNGGETEYTVGNNGRISLKNGEYASFTNQFRLGSYVGISEILTDTESNLYSRTWAITENGEPVTSYGQSSKVTGNIPKNPLSGTGNAPDDNRTEKTDAFSGGNYNAYTTAAKPTGNAILFRSYSNPDDSVNIKLRATVTNKVNTGSLVVSKAKANMTDDISGSYTFTVTFSNIGGVGLTYQGATTLQKSCTLQLNEEKTWSGIPVGTEYTIVETVTDGSTLDSVNGTDNDATVNLSTRVVKGVISYDANTNTKGEVDSITFVNTKEELVSIDIIKVWDRLLGTTVPVKAYLRLEYTTTPDDDSSWDAVDGYSKFELTATKNGVTVTNENLGTTAAPVINKQSWKYTISGLPQKDGTDTYYYRLREYDSTGTDLLSPLDKFSNKFTVSYGDIISADDNIKELTVTNTYTYINMPETGVSPIVNFAVIGVSAVVLAVIALLIYKRRLQTAEIYTDERRRH